MPRPLRNAVRRPGFTAAWLWHNLRYSIGHCDEVDVMSDWPVPCHPASRLAFSIHRHEPELQDELASFVRECRPGMVFLDVGAHYGLFTLAALHYGSESSRAVAVEPSASARRILEANLRLARAGARATIVPAALSLGGGSLATLTTGPGGFHQLVRPAEIRPDTVPVPALSLDALVTDLGVAPTHVKVDVEGFEKDVLTGGRQYLLSHHPVLFLELHGSMLRAAGDEPADVLALLSSFGYGRFESRGQAVTPGQAASSDLIRLVCRTG